MDNKVNQGDGGSELLLVADSGDNGPAWECSDDGIDGYGSWIAMVNDDGLSHNGSECS